MFITAKTARWLIEKDTKNNRKRKKIIKKKKIEFF